MIAMIYGFFMQGNSCLFIIEVLFKEGRLLAITVKWIASV